MSLPLAHAASLSYSRYHIVEKGDSLWEIGKQYGVSIDAIRTKNNLRKDTIYPKQKLIIPLTMQGVYHPVREGETLWRICRTYAVDVEEVVLLNRLANPNCIIPGQRIFIPGATKVREIPIPQPEAPAPSPSIAEADGQDETTMSEAAEPLTTDGFSVWPVESTSAYRESGFGIDITVTDALAVRVVAAGEVVGEGDLRQFGTKKLSVIAVEHEGLGLYTVYMYSGHSLVSTGDRVEASQTIAMLEEAGAGEETVLHFEVRQLLDAEPLDPLDYLP